MQEINKSIFYYKKTNKEMLPILYFNVLKNVTEDFNKIFHTKIS